MTLLVSWVAVDTHGPSSIYIVSDSRITWAANTHFDMGRKVFSFRDYPDILGYCGDVLFPALALSQIVALADNGLLFDPRFTSEQRFQAVVDKLNDLVSAYPSDAAGLSANSLTILHASRETDGQAFSSRSITWTATRRWRGSPSVMPTKSDVTFALGTAAQEFQDNLERYRSGSTGGTSRSVFHCFCDTLTQSRDRTIGGPPQLAGIIRKPGTGARTYGVVYRGQRSYLGAHIDNLRHFNLVEWRNENFELCDGRSMRRRPDAQLQPDPLRRA